MINVGVIRGGISSEYEVSLNTGGNVLSVLRSDFLNKKYKAIDLLIDKDGLWHMNGLPTTPKKISLSMDVVFNALHGDYGEDGQIQKIFEEYNIPYTGSNKEASFVGYNKVLSKEQFSKLGIKTPQYILFPAYLEDMDGPKEEYSKRKAREVLSRIPPPWIVKPLTGGSSMGMHLCKTIEDLVNAFMDGVNQNVSILVEELIKGKEATVGVINGFRNQDVYALPPIEIRIPKTKDFFDYEAKYTGISQEICPGNFSNCEKDELIRLASLIHTGLNLDHYSRSDFIIDPKRGIYALEVNTLPGLTDESLTPKALYAVGATLPEFIDHIINLALERSNKIIKS